MGHKILCKSTCPDVKSSENYPPPVPVQFFFFLSISHCPMKLINLTTLQNNKDSQLLINLVNFFHAYNCKQLILAEVSENIMK